MTTARRTFVLILTPEAAARVKTTLNPQPQIIPAIMFPSAPSDSQKHDDCGMAGGVPIC
jgi:hypothetical protein